MKKSKVDTVIRPSHICIHVSINTIHIRQIYRVIRTGVDIYYFNNFTKKRMLMEIVAKIIVCSYIKIKI